MLVVLLAFILIPVGTLTGLAGPPPQGGEGETRDEGSRGEGGSGEGPDGRPRGGSGQGQHGDPLDSFSDFPGQPGEQPVAVVLLHDDYDPPLGYYYLRQTAFSQFNGQRLVAGHHRPGRPRPRRAASRPRRSSCRADAAGRLS